MKTWILSVLMVAALVSACTLTTTNPVELTPTAIAVTAPIGVTVSPTPTQRVTATPLPPVATDIIIATACVPRADWLLYTVRPEDTLANIARRINSTAAALAQGNCLANPDLIEVGQVLRLPALPPDGGPPLAVGMDAQVTQAGDNLRVRSQPGTNFDVMGELVSGICVTITNGPVSADGFTWWQVRGPRGLLGWVAEGNDGETWLSLPYTTCVPVSAGPDCIDPSFWAIGDPNPVTLAPALAVDGACYTVAAGETIVVAWPSAPADATEVTFYRRSPQMERSDVFAVDSTPGDGFSATLTIFPGMPPSVIYAESVSGGQQGSLVRSGSVGITVAQ